MATVHLISFFIHTRYYPSFHHGLASLIGALKSQGNQVQFTNVCDESDISKLLKILESEPFDIVGFSFTTTQIKYIKKFIDSIKIQKKLLIAGGAHVTTVKENIFLEIPQLDAICIGDGEQALVKLCERIDQKKNYYDIESMYFHVNDTIKKNPIAVLPDIDKLPLPDYSLFDYKKVIEDSGRSFPMMISRGCPFSCSYCCNHIFRLVYPPRTQYVRFPSVQHAMQIIKNNLSLYPNTEKIVFNDDILVLNKKWLKEFCMVYAMDIGLPFRCNARVELIDEETAKCLKDAGCLSVAFGIESGNEWIRRYVLNRPYTNQKIREAFSKVKRYGLKTFSYNMVGLPFETACMVRETVSINRQIQPDFGVCFYFYPFPGTTINELCRRFGFMNDGIDSVSGILESPIIKEIFMSHHEIKKYFEILTVFFYARLIFSKIKLPQILEQVLLSIIVLFRKPLLLVLNPESSIRLVRTARAFLRQIALRYIR